MPGVYRKHKNEKFDSLMRRFKKAVDDSDIMKEVREREFYEKPSAKRKRQKAAAVKRAQREQAAREMLEPSN